MSLQVLILAAGQGTRMKSSKAKVLHSVAGYPLISHVYRTALSLRPERVVVVVGHQADEVKACLTAFHPVACGLTTVTALEQPDFVLQAEQRGTGHAVLMARDLIGAYDGHLLVLSGDVPQVSLQTLQRLYSMHTECGAAVTVLTTEIADPTGYGRVLRDEAGEFERIVEHRDATPEQRGIKEINSGIYCFKSRFLFSALERVTPDNDQKEIYLTDVLGIARNVGAGVAVLKTLESQEVLGINNRVELVDADKRFRRRKCQELLLAGVTILDPENTYIDIDVEVGADTVIYPGARIEGASVLGSNCEVGTGARLVNCTLGQGVTVKDYSLVYDSVLEDGVTVGPFAHIRMGARLKVGATIGNFVEVKKSILGSATKAMHLAYLGDAVIGERVNIGAGTITCNYDGKSKHQTHIEDGVKIGSDTMLVAPVTVGRNSITGAGSVVTKDIPSDSLAYGVPAEVKKRL